MYKVTLSACGNIDHFENPYNNIVHGIKIKSNVVECNSIEECQKVVRKYIEDNLLGGSNWTGGKVFKDNELIGRISYNGRFWENGSEYCK